MRKLHLGLAGAFIGLATAVAVTACGTDETRGAVCAVDTDCHANELCHPQARRCVTTCRSAESCEDDGPRDCQPLSEADARNICKCTEEAQCQGEPFGSAGTCSASLQVCVTRCGEDGACPEGQACDTTTNECRGTGVVETP